jgi:ribonuclease P protein component
MVASTEHFALHCLALPSMPELPPGEPARVHRANALAGPASLFPTPGAWIGALVPKRWARRAVTRNALKRQIYTLAASLATGQTQSAYVVRLRKAFARVDYVSASSLLLKQAARRELLALMPSASGPEAGRC